MRPAPERANLSLSFAMLFCASLHHVKERGSDLCQNVWAAVVPAALSPFGIAKVADLFQLRNTPQEKKFRKNCNCMNLREKSKIKFVKRAHSI